MFYLNQLKLAIMARKMFFPVDNIVHAAFKMKSFQNLFNPFQANAPSLYPLKTSENQGV